MATAIALKLVKTLKRFELFFFFFIASSCKGFLIFSLFFVNRIAPVVDSQESDEVLDRTSASEDEVRNPSDGIQF